jgi:hypothetical protein
MPGKTDLVLHIGTEKTGTTSIQSFLEQNRNLLLSNKIYIPDFLGKSNHRHTAHIAQEDNRCDAFARILGIAKNSDTLSEFKKRKILELSKKAEEYSDYRWIISSEHLQSRLTSHKEIFRLKEILDRSFSSITILIYLRDPIQTAISAWSTSIKVGGTASRLGDPGKFQDNNCNHKAILTRWLKIFNKSQFKVRIFDAKSFHEGNLLRDFCLCSSIKWDDKFAIPDRQNEILPFQALKLLARINSNIPLFTGDSINPIRGDLLKYFMEHFKGFPGYLPSSTEVHLWKSYYQQSAEYVREEFFPKHKGSLWSPSKIRDADDKNTYQAELTELEIAIVTMISDIWKKKMRKIIRIKKTDII